jgi:hypothetical protein
MAKSAADSCISTIIRVRFKILDARLLSSRICKS